MGLTAWLLRHTPPRPMIVELPGGARARVAVERAARERGWKTTTSPAEANILVVAGQAVEPYVTRVWDSVPAPRTRLDVTESFDERELDLALARLRDVESQRAGAPGPVDRQDEVPMADRARDRDGLMLDRLRVPLGPVLPLWPAGLVVHTRLQGDVIQEASVELVGAAEDTFWFGAGPVARRLDSCARLLALAGWPEMATEAKRLRDDALDDALDGGQADGLRQWVRRVRRSATLRWLLAGVGEVADDPGTPEELVGDALSRLHRWLGLAGGRDTTQWTVAHLPALLVGSELASARLTVASFDLDLTPARHG